jgi:predicted RNA-binding protein with PIN domain
VSAGRPQCLIVDGMNVIGSRGDGWWRDRRAAMDQLVAALRRLSAETGDAVTVVFDGAPHVPGGNEADEPRIVFAARRGRDAADDRIVELVGGDESPGDLVVATSDRALAARVRALGAQVIGAGALARRLDASRQTGAQDDWTAGDPGT